MPIYRPPAAEDQALAKQAREFMKSPSHARSYMDGLQNQFTDPFGGLGGWGGLNGGGWGAETSDALGPGSPMGAIPGGMGDRDWLAGALTAEGGSAQDKRYIASVIGNRLNSGQWGDSLKKVILAPGQFSAFNGVTGYAGGEQGTDHWRNPTQEAYQIADALIQGQIADQTGGALNYYTTWGGSAPVPKWGGSGFRRLPGSTHYFGTAR